MRWMIWLLALLFLPNAMAARAYFDGTFQSLSTVCPVTGNAVVVSQSFVGYFTDPNEPYPKTGDIAYVRAVSANVSGCVNDAVGFDFFLPDGATPAVSASYPVYCYRVRLSDGYTEAFTNDANGACSQTASTGPFGGLYYGWSAVASGWWVEIRVPVQFNKQLLGLGGPSSHRLSAVAQTAYGNATPYQPVTVFYEADYLNTQSSGVTATSATLGTNLYSYFKSGLLYVDYGTSASFGSSTSPASVPNTSLNFPSISTSLTGLSPSTTYYWRYRFVTDAGTFNSPTQNFTTSAAPPVALSVSKSGTGSGTLSSSPAGINCGATCSANFAQGTSVSLTPTPASGSVFAGWGGACSGTGSCTVTMDAAKSVSATFNTAPPNTFSLTVSKAGTGSGTVLSNPAGINCGSTCSASFNSGTSVTLSATAASGSSFAGWGGACSGTGSCTVTMDAAKSVSATFNTAPPNTFSLTVSKAGTGSGTVLSNPAGINCGSTCSASFNSGTSVTLSATAASGSSFAGWGGACTGTGSCTVTMSAAQSVTATFNTAPSLGSLSLEVSGLPSGNSATLTVTGPGGFSQQRTILSGTGQTLSDVVTGSYTVSAPSVVVGSTTYNPNQASQTVTVNTGNTTVSVTYAQAPNTTVTLSLSKAGTGAGTVSSSPAGINCGATCSANFSTGASVILTATPDSGSTFAGWSGACSGTGSCTVSMSAAQSVTATFNTAPTGSVNITASKPANAPQDTTRNKGQSNVPMLAFSLTASQAANLQGISVQASGSGNDSLDLTAVKLFRDTNANGQIDSGETAIATGTFSADNGTLTLSPASVALSTSATQFIVAADLNTTLALYPKAVMASSLPNLPAWLALLLVPMLLLGAWRLRSLRVGFLAVSLALTLGACTTSNPQATSKTYQINLTALNVQSSPTVSGLPISGATITVQK